MEALTQKELLIKTKQDVVLLEQQLETIKLQLINTDKKKSSGYGIFLFFLGTAIFLGGAAGLGVPAIFIPGFLIAIAGVIIGISRSVHNKTVQKNVDELNKKIQTLHNKIIGNKNRIIEIETM